MFYDFYELYCRELYRGGKNLFTIFFSLRGTHPKKSDGVCEVSKLHWTRMRTAIYGLSTLEWNSALYWVYWDITGWDDDDDGTYLEEKVEYKKIFADNTLKSKHNFFFTIIMLK